MATFTDDPLRRDGFARIHLKDGDHIDVPMTGGVASLTYDGSWYTGRNVYGGGVSVRATMVTLIVCWPPAAQAARQAERDAESAEEKPSWMD